MDQCFEKENTVNTNAFKVIIKDKFRRAEPDHLDLSDGESGMSSTEDNLDTPCDSGDEPTSGRGSPVPGKAVLSKSRTNIPEILVDDLSIQKKGSHPELNEGSHSTVQSYRKHLFIEDSEDTSSGYESAASVHKPSRAKKRVSSSKRTQLLRAAMLAEHASANKGKKMSGYDTGRAQDVHLDVSMSSNAQHSSEDESSTCEDPEGSQSSEEGSHCATEEGSPSSTESHSSDEEQDVGGEVIRICIVDPLEEQSENGKQNLCYDQCLPL